MNYRAAIQLHRRTAPFHRRERGVAVALHVFTSRCTAPAGVFVVATLSRLRASVQATLFSGDSLVFASVFLYFELAVAALRSGCRLHNWFAPPATMSMLNAFLAEQLKHRLHHPPDMRTLEVLQHLEDENTWLKLQLAKLHVS